MKRTFKHMAMWTWPNSVLNEDPRRMASRLKDAHVDIIIPYTCPQRETPLLFNNIMTVCTVSSPKRTGRG